ncbi:M61 family metallopeptidase [Sediminibacterium ginsengisoli]|uniref:Predicted metalloprotease, contains C-terminal PDZ domain n=1 Tax=Sediminibacterium ginsengisoli TaxID=413434 RepID=A0A1T4QIL5_9BACT|nr:PDZ domain-containing protein [Sediminibacterium ginsengisoli]SKA03108.1 Predicted metalloprotease, contains C-terminal PDZ domain [Sediminibacterium ginsengisoli]
MKKILSLSLSLLLYYGLHAQKMQYKVSFPNAVHHEAHIELTASGIPLQPAVFRMSRSSPGRYATHEFGKNVYDVSAKDLKGNALAVKRIDGDVYEVAKHTGTVTLSYTLYANYPDGTYAGIDPESIHLNMPACFMWMKGQEKAPIEISFDLPKENKGIYATQLVPTSKPGTFTAPGLQYFFDSPTKIGDLVIKEWTVSNADGKSFTIRVALEANATADQVEEYVSKVKRIVAEAKEVFGEYPAYDYGTYTFIVSATPYVFGDGMEHRNSTMISTTMNGFNANRLQGVTSHEYFHNWNVERIRPKTLEPFNFEKSNMSNELWCAEGFTQYYGDLILARAGLKEERSQLATMSGLASTKLNSPGGRFYSPVDASNHAVFVDAAVSIDKNNYGNMFTSYYTYGAAIALALDLELQSRYGKSIDVFMQAMWKRFGKTEIPYTIPAMQETLASVSDAAFAADFFRKYINGHEAIDYAALFSKAGYDFKNSTEGKATAGTVPQPDEQNKLVISRNTTRGTAAYEAGLDINDEILKLDETAVKSSADFNNYIQSKKPGDKITITYKHRGTEKTTVLTLKEQISYTLVPFEQSGKTVTDAMKKMRDSWFKTKTK